MGTKFIVVASGDNPKEGAVTVLDDAAETERFVEVLLRAGVEQERIQIFSGGEMHSQITQRPVVTLIAGELEASAVTETSPAQEDSKREAATRDHGAGTERETPPDWTSSSIRAWVRKQRLPAWEAMPELRP